MNTISNINKKPVNKRVLVAPLDWGLGHATRCIPIINVLKKEGVEVLVAGEGPTLEILVKSLPGIVFLPLKGYRVTYSPKKLFFVVYLLAQTFKIRKRIKEEHRWLKQVMETHNIHAVISDNRYGLWSNSIPSVFITHQLGIKTGNRALDFFARIINHKLIRKFNSCWLADAEGENNLAGELSHPKKPPSFRCRYVGLLSRFSFRNTPVTNQILFLISGPEPARTIFEEKILRQLGNIQQPVVLVRGLPKHQHELTNLPAHAKAYNHLETDELTGLVASAKLVVCRAGYSTLMDLTALRIHAVIVPTPGQTEQEYLAGYLHGKKLFLSVQEDDFEMNEVVQKFNTFNFSDQWPSANLNEVVIKEFTSSLF